MTAPLSTFSGLASGVNFRDLTDAIIAADRAPADRARKQADDLRTRLTEITTYRGLLEDFQAAVKSFQDGSAIGGMATTVSPIAGTATVLGATADQGAVPATYQVEVTALATAQKLTSSAVADPNAALGQTGTFTVNGVTVSLAAGDSLIDLRDAFNVANTGTTASKVGASILKVDATTYQLILTSEDTGAAGMSLADTSGSPLQSLGYLDGTGAVAATAQLVAGSDASFKIDNIAFTRTSNVVSDVIENVTLTLTGSAVGTINQLAISRDGEAARTGAQAFVDAYNALTDYIKTQNTATPDSRPPLYGESIIRLARSSLPATILTAVNGAATDLNTLSAAGFSLGSDGRMSLDTTTFDSKFATRFSDLATLFQESRTASVSSLDLTVAGPTAAPGTYAVDITAVATQAQVTSTGFAGTYDDGGTPDTLTLTDSASGKTATVALTTGMTTADIVGAVNTAAQANGLNITAAASGNDVQLTHGQFGSAAGITAQNTAGGGDGAAELFITAASASGTDVAGTIGGVAATGSGQSLIADTGTTLAGMTVRYAGATTGAIGTVTLDLGTAAQLDRFLAGFTQFNTGLLDLKDAQFDQRITDLENRATSIETRLEVKRQRLIQQFVKMESAIARLQQQSAGLLSLAQPQGANQ